MVFFIGFDHYLNSIYLELCVLLPIKLMTKKGMLIMALTLDQIPKKKMSIKNKKKPPKNIKSGYSYPDWSKEQKNKKT